jgi:carbamoyltransferase
MYILGISTLGRSTAVAMIDEQSVLFAIEEEKLSRNESSEIPRLALERCLHETHTKIEDCRAIAMAERSSQGSRRRKRPELSTEQQQLQQLLRGGPRPAHFDHHLCHAASAYYTSGFDRALIVSLDEGTNSQSGLVALGDGDEIRPLQTLKFPDSLGWFYTRATELVGLRGHKDEHKLQWLSKDGEPEYLPVFRKLFTWKANGVPVLNRRYFDSGPDHRGIFAPQLYRELGLLSRGPAPNPVVRANLARSAQDYLEEVVLQLVQNLQEQTHTQHLCLAGGSFLNVFLVRALETQSAFPDVYVQPVSGNAGTALGAAYLLRRKILGYSGRGPLASLAFGMQASSQEIKAVLDNCKITYRYLSSEDQSVEEAVQLLQRDKIVAWCQGRTEFGHRALGNRSLLASPFSEYVVENVNQFIKHREGFHPFALSVPAERAGEYFEASANCRFMASLGMLKQPVAGLERFAFRDGSIRVHTVEKHASPLFWKLLNKFGESAPAPILVNTSFNLFGEPLVTDPRGAVRSFYCAGVDALALGPFLLVK